MAAGCLPPYDRRTHAACLALAIGAAALAGVVAVRWGAFAVGGSDSHCYAGQARMFAEGRLSLPPPIPPPVPWPQAAATFAPSGFAPGPDPAGSSVPLCAAGLAVAMAAVSRVAGEPAVFAVVPIMGMLAVWSTWVLGRRLAGPAVGAASALLLACSPIFLHQAVQPMSDVPAAALWTASLAAVIGTAATPRLALLRGLAAGLLAGAAITVRPNLAPLAVVPLALAWPSRRAVLAAAAGIAPGVAAVALLQAAIYGSPFTSGYGDLGQLFSAANVGVNLVSYAGWLAIAHTPVLAIALLAPLAAARRREAVALAAFALGVVALYLPYVPYTDWWYSRFLLPALPAVIALTMTVLERAAGRLPRRAGLAALLAVTLALAAAWLGRADRLAVFRVKSLERKYVELGRLASRDLPPNAVVLAAQPAGSVRYYARRPTLSWDAIEPAWLDRVLAECRARGFAPYLAVESWERAAFRSRFRGHGPAADLDWPPRAVLGGVIYLYDFGDRDRYLAGERIPMERVVWGRR